MIHSRMYNEYLDPYKAAVEAGVGSVMSSFTEVDGIPATANKFLMTDVLRDQWNFKGFVVSDYSGINEMIDHGMGDLKKVSALALNAGINMDMFLTTLKQSFQEGKVTAQQINNVCRLILEAKYKLGLFEDPFKYCDEKRAPTEIFIDANLKTAREVAAQTFVLLKNNGQLLPLKKSGTIALVGPLADSKENMLGTWAVAADYTKPISLIAGIKNVVGNNVNVIYAKGANISNDIDFETRVSVFGKPLERDDRPSDVLIKEALEAAAKADIIVAAVGEAAEMTRESSSRSDIGLPQSQKDLLKTLVTTGKPVVLVLFTGRPLTLQWEQENVPAIINVWHGGTEAGNAVADVLFGDVNPSGKLTNTWPQNVGQIPLFYNHKNTGKPLEAGKWFQKFRSNYLDVSNDPVYSFGYGLSYRNFSYSDVTLNKSVMHPDEKLDVKVTVTNTGNYDGAETVQLYMRDLVASISRPVKELKGFEKIYLKKGESKEVHFTITANDLKFYNSDLKFVYEPGTFKVMVGGSSDKTIEKSFDLVK